MACCKFRTSVCGFSLSLSFLISAAVPYTYIEPGGLRLSPPARNDVFFVKNTRWRNGIRKRQKRNVEPSYLQCQVKW